MKGWFNQTQRRMKEGIKQAVGVHQKTEDEIFDKRLREWEFQVQNLRKVKESIEIFLDAQQTAAAAGTVLCEAMTRHFSFSTSSNEESPYMDVMTLFEKINADISNVVQPAFRSTVLNRCIRPLNAILSKVNPIYEQISKRKTLLVDFDAYKSKVHAESMANNPHLERTQQKLQNVSQELAILQADTFLHMDDFDSAMPSILGNELAAMIASMYFCMSSSAVLLGQILPLLPQAASTLSLMSIASASAQYVMSPSLLNDIEGDPNAKPVPVNAVRGEWEGGEVGEYGAHFERAPLPYSTYESDVSAPNTAPSTARGYQTSFDSDISDVSAMAPPPAAAPPVPLGAFAAPPSAPPPMPNQPPGAPPVPSSISPSASGTSTPNRLSNSRAPTKTSTSKPPQPGPKPGRGPPPPMPPRRTPTAERNDLAQPRSISPSKNALSNLSGGVPSASAGLPGGPPMPPGAPPGAPSADFTKATNDAMAAARAAEEAAEAAAAAALQATNTADMYRDRNGASKPAPRLGGAGGAPDRGVSPGRRAPVQGMRAQAIPTGQGGGAPPPPPNAPPPPPPQA